MKSLLLSMLLSASLTLSCQTTATLHFLRAAGDIEAGHKLTVYVNNEKISALKDRQRLRYEISVTELRVKVHVQFQKGFHKSGMKSSEPVYIDIEPGKDYYLHPFFSGPINEAEANEMDQIPFWYPKPLDYAIKVVELDETTGRQLFTDRELYRNRNESLLIYELTNLE